MAVTEEVEVENGGSGGQEECVDKRGRAADIMIESTKHVTLTGHAIILHTFLYDRKTTSMMNEMIIRTQCF